MHGLCQKLIDVENYLVDVLSLNSREKGSDAAVLSLNTSGGEKSLDVVGGGGSIATGSQQKVSSEVFHFFYVYQSIHPLVNCCIASIQFSIIIFLLVTLKLSSYADERKEGSNKLQNCQLILD